MTAQDINNFNTYLTSQLPSNSTLTASPVRVALNDTLDTIRAVAFEYKGTFNPSSSSLVNGTGLKGDVYKASVTGTKDFGAGTISFVAGDLVFYDGAIWGKLGSSSAGGGGVAKPTAIADGGTIPVNLDVVLASTGTFLIGASSDDDLLLFMLRPSASVTITGIGTVANPSTTKAAYFRYFKDAGTWRRVIGFWDEFV